MTPIKWWERVLWWFTLSLRPKQCCSELPVQHGVVYCVRTRGHPGLHETFDGESFQ